MKNTCPRCWLPWSECKCMKDEDKPTKKGKV